MGDAHRVLVFHQALIITTQADQEQYACDILETMDPLSPLALLPTHIDHEHFMVLQLEDRLSDTDRPSPASNNVLFRGNIIQSKQSI